MIPPFPAAPAEHTAPAVSSVVELLEILWGRGRDVPGAPVSPSQLRAMFVLADHEGINLRALCDALDSKPSSVSRLCDRLEAVGYVERAPSASSRRELELRLSEGGRAFLGDLRDRREQEVHDILAAMPPRHREALITGLQSFRDTVWAQEAFNGLRTVGKVGSRRRTA